jgi:predicted ATPase
MLAYLALTLAYLGHLDQARSRMDEALSRSRRLRHIHTQAITLFFANWLDWLIRSPNEAQMEEGIAVTTEHGFPFYGGWALAFRGRSLITCGRTQEGLTLLTQGLTTLRPTGGAVSTPMMLTWLAEAHAMLGQSAQVLSFLGEAAHKIEISEERVSEAELLHRIPGDLLNASGDRSAAERSYRQAIAVAERQSAKLFQLRAATSLARLMRDQGGRQAEAHGLLAPIYGWFTEGFDTSDLMDAKALLDELA